MAERMDDYGAGAARQPGAADADAVAMETTVIRAEIVETRERMSDTLDELGERLNPHVIREQVTERVKDGIRDATIGRVEHMARTAGDKLNETKSTMADTIRENPIPAAMVAVGLGWLLWNGRSEASSSSYRRQYAAGYPYGGSNLYTGSGAYAGESAGMYGGDAYGYEGGTERSAAERARERAGAVASGAKERAHDLADRAGDAADAVRDRAHDLADTVADRTRRGAGRVEDGFYANPLAAGAIAAAVGIAAGFAAPTTDREVALMGGARDRLVDRVKDKAGEVAEKAQHVAERTAEEVKTAAKDEGLTPR